ncbi:MAG: undecaprenyl-phosphate glucose phosphotransferase [Ignavibacteria bacterium]|nr:undecaprenyl-phosphate glucose phosphotransferase [Ignavibacteria bacterium]
MKGRHTKVEVLLPILTILFDALSIFLAYLNSYYIRFFSSFQKIFPVTEGIPELSSYIYFFLSTVPIWILVFQTHKLYRLNRNVFILDEFPSIIKCVTISIIVSIGILFFFRGYSYSRLVFVLIWLSSIVYITISRYLMLKLEKTLYNKKIATKNVALIGSNKVAEEIYDRFQKNTYVGFNVIGYFNREGKECFKKNMKLIGDYNSIPSAIKSYSLQKLILCFSSEETNDLYSIFKICEGINIELILYPQFLDIVTSKLKIEHYDGIPFMKLKSIPMNVWNRMIKRIFDIVFSVIFLILTFPLFLIIAIIIKLTSKGPIFYLQERVGMDGKKFMIYKFRSMVVDAEKDGPAFATPDDKRYTKIGKFLRKYSLDELPQFINVLKGDMSVVGPRPEREYFVNQMKQTIVKYLERHRVKSGITGWAQVNGYRGSTTSMQTRIDYDIYYIENWSLAFDLKIIFKTLKEAFFSKSAV